MEQKRRSLGKPCSRTNYDGVYHELETGRFRLKLAKILDERESMTSYSISEINQMDKAEFVQSFGSIFEETPRVAEQAWAAMPFQDVADLHQKMVTVVEKGMTNAEKLTLIQSHPELGANRKMAAASVQEQAGAGFNQTMTEVQKQIQQQNAVYQKKFGFPFIMAVRGQTLDSIAAAQKDRIAQSKEDEVARSLSEIYKIARFRLDNLIKP